MFIVVRMEMDVFTVVGISMLVYCGMRFWEKWAFRGF